MAEWLQLLPGESILYRTQQTPRGALILASAAALGLLIAIPSGAALTGLFFEPSQLPLWRQIAILGAAVVIGAAITILLVYRAMEFVVTDRRVVYRRGLVIKRQTQMWLDDIAEIKPEQNAEPGRPFRLNSTDGRSLTISTLADLDRLRQVLVRQTGLPDPMVG